MVRSAVTGTVQRSPLPDPHGVAGWARRWVSSLPLARPDPCFDELERFCLFVGYARSGHTLVGSMLNAHPEVVIAHELDAVSYVRHHFTRNQIFGLLMERDRTFGSMGWTWAGYDYGVSGQHQGRHERLRVLGDKRGNATALQIAQWPELLDRTRRVVKVPIRVIHVTRNPFDNIATAARKHEFPPRRVSVLSQATAWYERSCASVAKVLRLLDASESVDIRYETFVEEPADSLAEVCRFVGIEPDATYLDACAGQVWPSVNKPRHTVDWSAGERRDIDRLIERYDFLRGYTFDG